MMTRMKRFRKTCKEDRRREREERGFALTVLTKIDARDQQKQRASYSFQIDTVLMDVAVTVTLFPHLTIASSE